MPLPRQEYESCYPFVWCVRPFDFVNWLGMFLLEFSSEFSIFVILLFSVPVWYLIGNIMFNSRLCHFDFVWITMTWWCLHSRIHLHHTGPSSHKLNSVLDIKHLCSKLQSQFFGWLVTRNFYDRKARYMFVLELGRLVCQFLTVTLLSYLEGGLGACKQGKAGNTYKLVSFVAVYRI